MTVSRTLQVTALVGALAVGVAVYLFVGGMAGLLYAAAALVLGLFVGARLKAGEEAAAAPVLPGGRWLGRGSRIAALELALGDAESRLEERDTHVAVLRRELDEQRELARALERRFTQQLTELEAAHEAGVDRVLAGIAGVESELGACERLVGELASRADGWAREDSSHGGVTFVTS